MLLQYNHYFSTTYDEGYNKVVPKVPEDAKALKSEFRGLIQ